MSTYSDRVPPRVYSLGRPLFKGPGLLGRQATCQPPAMRLSREKDRLANCSPRLPRAGPFGGQGNACENQVGEIDRARQNITHRPAPATGENHFRLTVKGSLGF